MIQKLFQITRKLQLKCTIKTFSCTLDIKNPSELHWAEKTASNFDVEIKPNVSKYIAPRFSSRFVSSIKNNFDNGRNDYIPMFFWKNKGFHNSPTIPPSKISLRKRLLAN